MITYAVLQRSLGMLVIGCLCVIACARPADNAEQRPNIIIILADDMGFSDIGCYGSEIHTPNIDALAAQGLRFTQFYNAARCNPTRAALLTGLYPHQAGMGFATGDLGLPGYQGRLSDQCVTIAEVLRDAGYTTLMSGKWHLGDQHPHWPVDRGFDRHWGLIDGASSFFRPEQPLAEDDQIYKVPEEGFYMTDFTTAYAERYIQEYAPKEHPFFLYLTYTAPHWPLHALPEDIAKYRGTYSQGWELLRQERRDRMVHMGLVDARWPLQPFVPHLAWGSLSQSEQELWDLKMAVYAAQIDRMDQGIGRVLESVKAAGEEDNTVVFFLSDNGGCQVEVDRGTPGAPPGGADSYLAYGPYWAQASNTPFRRYKQFIHEGGISTPLIVKWPGVIADPGGLTGQMGHVIDLMPTCLELAGTAYPAEFKGRAILPVEGKSLVPIFKGQEREPHDVLYWEHTGNRGIREGDMKLVAERGKSEWALYNIQVDRTEMHDLSVERPETAQRLRGKWEQWADEVGVVSWDTITEMRRSRQRGGNE